ncbi:hypothetical protein FB451DRAFT_1185112 [Mycena latifolia]|nr:hypothetical protein FB451DRAFT_1185112 [Mycena latifolia]
MRFDSVIYATPSVPLAVVAVSLAHAVQRDAIAQVSREIDRIEHRARTTIPLVLATHTGGDEFEEIGLTARELDVEITPVSSPRVNRILHKPGLTLASNATRARRYETLKAVDVSLHEVHVPAAMHKERRKQDALISHHTRGDVDVARPDDGVHAEHDVGEEETGDDRQRRDVARAPVPRQRARAAPR